MSSAVETALGELNVQHTVLEMLALMPEKADSSKHQCLQHFLQKCNTHVTELINAETKSSISAQSSDMGPVILKIEQTSFVDPRGKFDVTMYNTGMILDGKTGRLIVEWANVDLSIFLQSPTSTKKEGESLLFLVLKEPIEISKTKKLPIVSWILSNGGLDMRALLGPACFNGKESGVVADLIEALVSKPHARPNKALFQTAAGGSFMRCYKGVQEGALFPLAEGILFFRPAIFVPSKDVGSIEAGRGGSAVTRYIDLKIERESDGKIFEYSNIDRDELPSIQGYVQHYVDMRRREEKRKSRVASQTTSPLEEEAGGSTATGIVDVQDEDDSDSSDDDFDPDNDEDEEYGGGSGSSDSEEDGGEDEWRTDEQPKAKKVRKN